ncbi:MULTISPECIES: hypothetical protein [unclassified Moorena]|uniref:hypothetical protein n=1 Tax=unclassified Moorena TaxID=2683338 RepID=UPI0013F947BB|nr:MULTISPECIES: hypothetical protein [unclassified Moorena]NEP21007.1 hypothetical protein [Moorena sp. SIO3I6]
MFRVPTSEVPCSLFPIPDSLFPIPCSLFPVPFAILDTSYFTLPILIVEHLQSWIAQVENNKDEA